MSQVEFKPGHKIVVLGGTGHLGSALIHHLVNELKFHPADIRVFYLAGSPTNSLNDIEGLDMFPGNILDITQVIEACNDREFVFHMIGNTSFDPRQKELQWRVNVEGTRNVLDACIKSEKLKRLCYTGTISALGLPDPIGSIGNYEDCSPYNPKNRMHSFSSSKKTLQFIEAASEGKIGSLKNRIGIGYLDSKLAAQELVDKYQREYNLNVVSVLPGTMFGPYDYLVGVGMYVIAIYNGQMPGVLKGGMSFMHVMDSVKGHLLALKKAKMGSHYVITGKKEDNLYLKDLCKKIAEIIQERNPEMKIKIPKMVFSKPLGLIGGLISETYTSVFNKPNPLSRDSVRAGSVPTFYSYESAKSDLGYEPQKSIKEAIEDTYDYYYEQNLLNQTDRYLDLR